MFVYGRDVILADDSDNIPGQFDGLEEVSIDEVTLPGIEVAGHTYTLDADSLADFAHRATEVDIVYLGELDEENTRTPGLGE